MPRRSKQGDFVSLNLRLPPKLHKDLVKAAGASSSLNSEIIRRLQGSFDMSEALNRLRKELDEKLSQELRNRRENVQRLEESIKGMQAELEARKLTENVLQRLQKLEARLPESEREGAAT
jgi:Na+/phosphate symporter